MHIIRIVACAAAALAGVSVLCAEQLDHWVYDATLEQITDGGWTFNASVANGTDLTVNAVISDPGEGATLDFSKPITDGADTTYTLVKLNPNFGAYEKRTNLATLVLPSEGLTTISKDAFRSCTALTSVTPYLPDSVTTLGEGVFYAVPAQQDLRLCAVATVPGSSFYGSGITTVYFGPSFKTVNGGYNSGAFSLCKSLTTITFDPLISDAYISGGEWHFYECSNLEGTIDMSGFVKILPGVLSQNRALFQNCNKISKLIFGSGLTHLCVGAFGSGLSGLREVEFKGKPPTFCSPDLKTPATGGAVFGGVPKTSALTTYIPKEYTNEWSVYAKDGVIDDGTTLWALEWTRGEDEQPLRPLIYKDDSGGGDLGVWVCDEDADPKVVTDGNWTFKAATSGAYLDVGAVVSVLGGPTNLDFMAEATTAKGKKLIFRSLNTDFQNAAAELRQSVAQLMIPLSVTTIGAGAFRGCTALTNVVNYLSDNVTSIGDGAFYSVPAHQDLRLYSIASVSGGAFYNSGITSVYFGPAFKTVHGGWGWGSFGNCASMTNIVFDPLITDAYIIGEERQFGGCTALAGTLDLSCFTKIRSGVQSRNIGLFDNSPRVTKVILGENLREFSIGTFCEGTTGLREVVFMGPPPTFYKSSDIVVTEGDPFAAVRSATLTTWVTRKYKNEWAAFAHENAIRHRGTHWKSDFISSGMDITLRPLLGLDVFTGLKLILR